MTNTIPSSCENHWHEEEISLKRSNNDEPLGITISGGKDKPYRHPGFTHIIITKIVENSLANKDNRLQLFDIIVSVDSISLINVNHEYALNILRKPGTEVKLLIRRLLPPFTNEIELMHDGKLGITIRGGLGSEYLHNDYGIFITKVNADRTKNRLYEGDRLLRISSTKNTYDLRFVTHDSAVKSIKLACSESRKIKLLVAHAKSVIRTQSDKYAVHQGQYDNFDDLHHGGISQLDETHPFSVTPEDARTQIADLHGNYQLIHSTPNRQTVDNRKKQSFIVSFGNCEKHENHHRVAINLSSQHQDTNRSPTLSVVKREQPQLYIFKFAKFEKDSRVLGVLVLQQSHLPTTTVTEKVLRHRDRAVNTDIRQLDTGQQENLKEDIFHRNNVSEQNGIHPSPKEQTTIGGIFEETLIQPEERMSPRRHSNGENSTTVDDMENEMKADYKTTVTRDLDRSGKFLSITFEVLKTSAQKALSRSPIMNLNTEECTRLFKISISREQYQLLVGKFRIPITFEDFIEALPPIIKRDESTIMLERSFVILGRNNSETINIQELSGILLMFNESINRDALVARIREFDQNHDGKLDFQEFQRLVLSEIGRLVLCNEL